jgi:hypothetical protein
MLKRTYEVTLKYITYNFRSVRKIAKSEINFVMSDCPLAWNSVPVHGFS